MYARIHYPIDMLRLLLKVAVAFHYMLRVCAPATNMLHSVQLGYLEALSLEIRSLKYRPCTPTNLQRDIGKLKSCIGPLVSLKRNAGHSKPAVWRSTARS